ncbi:MAG: InlB B-repeat-containing protein [Bacilli bacterium]
MKKNIFISTILCLVVYFTYNAFFVSAQNLVDIGYSQVGTTGGDRFNALAITSDGGYVATGSVSGRLPGQTHYGGGDGWVIKYRPDNTIEWSKQYGGTGDELFERIIQLPDGTYLAVGYSSTNLAGQSARGTNGWIVHISSSGNQLFSKSFDGGNSNSDIFVDIAPTNDGNFIIAGQTNGSFNGLPNNGGLYDAILVKVDASGNQIWAEQYGTSDRDQFLGVNTTSDGKIIASGFTRGSLYAPALGWDDNIVVKTDANGTVEWGKQFGTGLDDRTSSLQEAPDGGYILAGIMGSSFQGSPANQGSNASAIKLDTDGNVVWFNLVSSTGNVLDGATRVDLSQDGSYIFSGYTQGTFAGQTSSGGTDAIVFRVNTNGALIWTKQFGTSGSDLAYGVKYRSNGDVIAVGWTVGTLPGQANIGGADGFVFRLHESFDVNFNLNGASGTNPNSQTHTIGDKLTDPGNPTRTEYTFQGWNTKLDGTGVNWNFTNDIMTAGDLTLYANWKVNQYQLSFDVNTGDSPNPSPVNVDFNGLATAPLNPTKDGHRFSNWDTEPDGSGTAWDFATSRMPANNLTLYAQWDVESFNLTFNLNGGAGTSPPSQTVDFGEKISDPGNPSREGYAFKGWNTVQNGSGTMWNFTTNTMPSTPVSLFAQWDINTYTLSFNLNLGTGIIPPDQIIEFNSFGSQPPAPRRTGYTFQGWDTEADGSGIAWNFATNAMPANDVELFAQWTINTHNVVFNINGGDSTAPDLQTLNFDKLVARPLDPTRKGHTFRNWTTRIDGTGLVWDFEVDTMPDQELELYAQWDTNVYVASYSLNGLTGTVPDDEDVFYDETITKPLDPSVSGYTFVHWNTSADNTGKIWNFDEDKISDSDITLYAIWTKNSYTLSYNLNGGTGTLPSPQTIEFEAKATAPTSEPTRTGHTFAGWNTSADGLGITWNYNTSTMPANNVLLYAIWSINTYTLSFDLNGEYGAIPPTQSLSFESKAIPPNNPTRTGYTFKGWNTNANGQGKVWNFTTDTMPGSNLVLYAIWNEITTKTPSVPLQGNIVKTGNTLDYKVIAGFIVSLTIIIALVPIAIRNK